MDAYSLTFDLVCLTEVVKGGWVGLGYTMWMFVLLLKMLKTKKLPAKYELALS